MKETRKQKIDRQRGHAADRAFDPIRKAIDSGELVITPVSPAAREAQERGSDSQCADGENEIPNECSQIREERDSLIRWLDQLARATTREEVWLLTNDDQAASAIQIVRSAELALSRLRSDLEGLKGYVQHTPSCGVRDTGKAWVFRSGAEVPLPTACTCGLEALLTRMDSTR